MKVEESDQIPASFRDPSGFVYKQNGQILRQVNQCYQQDYDLLMSSGLYARLIERKLLIPHIEVENPGRKEQLQYITLKPEKVTFISYPYEWSFSQYRDAALQTLRIAKEALNFGMVLKDASAYNIQFVNNRPLLIDSLSFAIYQEGLPWVAYRQFCQHFLAPLALMSKVDISLGKLMQTSIDGIALSLASKMLPRQTRLQFGLSTHIHIHARAIKSYTNENQKQASGNKIINKRALVGLIESLAGTIQKLNWKPQGENWAEYYQTTNYTDQAFLEKKKIIYDILEQVAPQLVWDLGANTGVFSKIAKDRKDCLVISSDYDPEAVEINYLDCKKEKIKNILPLIVDLTNPSPAIGWANNERDAFFQRGPVDIIMALALIHHLAISNNVPFAKISQLFASLAKHLVIEFVPKEDSQVQRLLASRDDIFSDYNREGFITAFSQHFEIVEEMPLEGSSRVIFWMKRKI